MKKLLILIAVLSFTIVTKAQELPEHILKLMYTGNVISRFYVDDTDNNKITEAAVRAMLKELDPHSTYSDVKETKALLEQMQGSFGGIGIQFNVVSDTLYVIQTTTNGPSERAGILPGDRIVAVNDTAIAGVKMERSDIMTRLRGEKGTLIASGFIAGGALMGVVSALMRFMGYNFINDAWLANPWSEALALVMYIALMVYLVKATKK